jgi:replicative DNA helicase
MNMGAPHSSEAEQGVLGSMLLSPRETVAECVEKISDEHFFVAAHKTIYAVLVDLWRNGQAIDLITFTQVLRDRNLLSVAGGAGFVTSLLTFVPTAANIHYYIDIVREKHELRRAIAIGAGIVRRANEGHDLSGILAYAERELPTLRSSRERRIRFFAPSELRDFRPNNELVLVGDCHIMRGEVFVIGGEPGVGKSRAATWLGVCGATEAALVWIGRAAQI